MLVSSIKLLIHFLSFIDVSLYTLLIYVTSFVILLCRVPFIQITMRSFITILLTLTASAPFVSARCKISAATGDLGGFGQAFGISANKADANSQSDVTIFNTNSAFGQTRAVRVSPSFPINLTTMAKNRTN